MLKPESYVLYLESIILSLLKPTSHGLIRIKDPDAPLPMRGTTVSTVNLREEIAAQRALRK